jgi:ribosomal protein S27E
MFSIIRKSAEVVGLVDEVNDDWDDVAEQPDEPKTVEYNNISLKQVGNVPPIVIDPAVDLKHLVELFGLYEGKVKMMEVECPDCGYDETIIFQSLLADQMCSCSECGHEDEFHTFYEGTSEGHKFSRTPTDEELWLTHVNRSGISSMPRYSDWGYAAHRRNRLENYYLQLLGHEALAAEGCEFVGIIEGFWIFKDSLGRTSTHDQVVAGSLVSLQVALREHQDQEDD